MAKIYGTMMICKHEMLISMTLVKYIFPMGEQSPAFVK